MSRKHDLFASVRAEGALLPVDFLKKVAEGHKDVDGLEPESFDLVNERLATAVSRAWNRLQAAWASFKAARASMADDAAVATGLTREKWLLQIFMALDYGKLAPARGLRVKDKDYAISHRWQHVPIHLVGFGVDLDRRQPGVAGAARLSPHGLVQDYLNQEDGALWGIVSNGLRLRLLRDNVSLSRQAYVEFDLEAMFDGQLYADFHLFWTLCHQSRLNSEKPEDCWLEKWSLAARDQGSRALDDLRDGVQKAIETLGTGYLQHSGNAALRNRLESGDLTLTDLNRQLLRFIYRLLFLFVAEDRNLLLDPSASVEARELYREFYSTARLRRLAGCLRGTKHSDLDQSLKLLMGFLHDQGAPDLGLPALNSFLWAPEAIADLLGAHISNRYLLLAIRSVAFVERQRTLAPVDFRNLGAEELGAVYESLLELRPAKEGREYRLLNFQGNERKSTGSYYTPTNLINLLLKSALDPVLERVAAHADPRKAEEDILNLKICDPACGSGHFLVAAGHRVARRLAMVRMGEDEPSPEAIRHALRDVVGHCLYGVDRNEMAVELCKVSLWLEGMEPGRPLSFLEHRVICGNSLVGAIPALLAAGIPDEAFVVMGGDEKKVVSSLKKRNGQERTGQGVLELRGTAIQDQGSLVSQMQGVSEIGDDSVQDIRTKAIRFQAYRASATYQHAKLVADAWCFAFLGLKDDARKEYVTQNNWMAVQTNGGAFGSVLAAEVTRTARDYQFLHWHLEFPDVFRVGQEADQNQKMGWAGGFDVMIGNPPWERINLKEKEWFSQNAPPVAAAPNAAERTKRIEALQKTNPSLLSRFRADQRQADGEGHFIRVSGRYPLGGRGDVNTYVIFAELFRDHLSPLGRAGAILPSGLATDDTTKVIFGDIVATGSLVSFFDFENREGIFPAVHKSFKFALVTLAGARAGASAPDFVFFALKPEHLAEPDRHFTLTKADFDLISPNTGSCPIFRNQRDAELTKAIYRRAPIFIKEARGDVAEVNSWSASCHRMFHMSDDSGTFRTRRQMEEDGYFLKGNEFEKAGSRYLPLYEAKMIHQFDHRWATFEGEDARDTTTSEKLDPGFSVMPRYWVPEAEVDAHLANFWREDWLLGWRKITNATNERTMVSFVFPRAAAGDSVLMIYPKVSSKFVPCLLANLDSLILDFVVRQKIGGMNLQNHIIKQLPIFPPETYQSSLPWTMGLTLESWLRERIVKLVPFFDEGRNWLREAEPRRAIRAELDAAFMLLYGMGRNDVLQVLGNFIVLKKNELRGYGRFVTQEAVVDAYDRLHGLVEGRLVAFPIHNQPAEPFERLDRSNDPWRDNVVPIYTLEAAAGRYSQSQAVEEMDEMVRVHARRRIVPGMFVARVKGRSMEPTIPDNAWCLFQYPPAGSRTGRVLLIQHRDISDPETGGSYTVKRWQSDKVDDGEGGWRHTEIRLMPDNKDFQPIVLRPEDEGDVVVVADFVEVLN